MFGASGGAALFRSEMLDEIGGFDPSFFLFVEDADVAWRARDGRLALPLCPRRRGPPPALGHRAPPLSSIKHYHVGRNRIRLLAKNADPGLLLRYGVGDGGLRRGLRDRPRGDRPDAGAGAGPPRRACASGAYRRAGRRRRRPLELDRRRLSRACAATAPHADTGLRIQEQRPVAVWTQPSPPRDRPRHDWFQGFHGAERTVEAMRPTLFEARQPGRLHLPRRAGAAAAGAGRGDRGASRGWPGCPGVRQRGHDPGRWR